MSDGCIFASYLGDLSCYHSRKDRLGSWLLSMVYVCMVWMEPNRRSAVDTFLGGDGTVRWMSEMKGKKGFGGNRGSVEDWGFVLIMDVVMYVGLFVI